MSNQNGKRTVLHLQNWRESLTLRSLVFLWNRIYLFRWHSFYITYGIVTNTTHGHVSMTYVDSNPVMVFTTHSYCRMSKAFPSSGSALYA